MGINNLKKVIFFILLSVFLVIVTGCSTGNVCQEEEVKITPEEWQGEIYDAEEYCNALDYFGATESVTECVKSQLSWGLSERYGKYMYKYEECPTILAEERRQKQLDVDNKVSNIEQKSKKGIELKLDDYWSPDKLKEFKLQLNIKLEIPVDKVSAVESKEDDIRFFYLMWKKEDILDSQGQIKADFISSLMETVQEIKEIGEFEVIIVSVVEGDKDVGNLQINVFRLDESTDYNRVVRLGSGSGIFKR